MPCGAAKVTNRLAGSLALKGLNSLGSLARSLDEELNWLIKQHGSDTVREAAKRLTKKKAGRKQEVDLKHLKEWFDQDADDWLDGLDPFALRSNYAMAKHVSLLAKPHYRASTHRRVMRKLAARRASILMVVAWERAEKYRPHADYFRTCEALIAANPKIQVSVLWLADNFRGKVERYKERFGEIDPALTVTQIEEALNSLQQLAPTARLAGLLSSYTK